LLSTTHHRSAPHSTALHRSSPHTTILHRSPPLSTAPHRTHLPPAAVSCCSCGDDGQCASPGRGGSGRWV
ncbi:hypothetical protein CLOM_g282, partial [Closterium sp. NIES-68]